MQSAIYRGWVRHRRFGDIEHQFKYKVMFLWLDMDELEHPELFAQRPWFSTERFAALRYRASDYLSQGESASKARVWDKVESLGGEYLDGPVRLLGQVRCFGLYFSPINVFYCYDSSEKLRYVVAEVSNTPWNEKHWYLVSATDTQDTPKDFHVSPFMDLNMHYRWRIPAPSNTLCLHIENHTSRKVFDATLVMRKQTFEQRELIKALLQIPVMSLHIVTGIYWQALRLWLKRVRYVPYPVQEKSHASKNQ